MAATLTPPAWHCCSPPCFCAHVPMHTCTSMTMAVCGSVCAQACPCLAPGHPTEPPVFRAGHPSGLAELRRWSGVLEALGSAHHSSPAGKQLSGSSQSVLVRWVGAIPPQARVLVGAQQPWAPCWAPCPWLLAWGGRPSSGGPCLPLPAACFCRTQASRAARDGTASSAGQYLCPSRALPASLHILAHPWEGEQHPGARACCWQKGAACGASAALTAAVPASVR